MFEYFTKAKDFVKSHWKIAAGVGVIVLAALFYFGDPEIVTDADGAELPTVTYSGLMTQNGCATKEAAAQAAASASEDEANQVFGAGLCIGGPPVAIFVTKIFPEKHFGKFLGNTYIIEFVFTENPDETSMRLYWMVNDRTASKIRGFFQGT